MEQTANIRDRRTSVEVVFDSLFDEIANVRLLPGDKISEAEIAARFGVSRQPVRDAFSRLENLDLLLIRPQKATEVKKFSSMAIVKSRFIRSSVEAEVLRRAAALCDESGAALLAQCLVQQKEVVASSKYADFGVLDYAFHQTLCDIANVSFAFEIISAEKATVDRLCMLGLSKEDRMPQLLEDHENIANAVINGDAEAAVKYGMLHLSRLDATIEKISALNPDYFDE